MEIITQSHSNCITFIDFLENYIFSPFSFYDMEFIINFLHLILYDSFCKIDIGVESDLNPF